MTDRYSKFVLTVIAVCLVIQVIRAPANAQSPLHVIVDEVSQFAFQFATVPVKIRN